MLLRQLHEKFPNLMSGADSPRTRFDVYARSIRNELFRLRHHPVRIRVEAFCSLDFLSLFRPERRMELLATGTITYPDWRHAAAVRLASLYANSGKIQSQTDFEQRIFHWESNSILRAANGLPAWIRKVLTGKSTSPREDELLEKTIWNGVRILHFLKKGGTSLVYAAEYCGKPCVLKIPRPGCATRFRHELAILRQLHHPNLPELLAVSTEIDPYCVLELCSTGKCARQAGKIQGFLDALKHLHGSGILHGDLRTANLGIRPDGSPVLLDFSHARRAESFQETESEIKKMKNLLLA